jgi:hypothetical protein
VRVLQARTEAILSKDAIEQVLRAWGADPRKVAWAQTCCPEVPAESALRSVAEAMWDSAVPVISHYRRRPGQMRRVRRRWIDTLSQQPFVRWTDDAESYRAARPFTWESEKDMVERHNRRRADVSQRVSGSL